MKLYAQDHNASMSMHDDPQLSVLVKQLFHDENIRYIVETGTYLGFGSTTFLAKHFVDNVLITYHKSCISSNVILNSQ